MHIAHFSVFGYSKIKRGELEFVFVNLILATFFAFVHLTLQLGIAFKFHFHLGFLNQ